MLESAQGYYGMLRDAKGNDDGNDEKGSEFSRKIARAGDYSSTNRAYVLMMWL